MQVPKEPPNHSGVDTTESEVPSALTASEDNEIINFDQLVQSLKNIELPDSRYTLNIVESDVIITRWNPEFLCEKKVVIDQNLNMKVTKIICI